MSDCGQCIVLYDWLLNSRFVFAVNANIESICKMYVPFSFVVCTLLWIAVCLFCWDGNIQQWFVTNTLCCSPLIRNDSDSA